MNEGICKSCRRYVKGTSEKWFCAKDVWGSESRVVPGYFSYILKNRLNGVSTSWNKS
jgi:hypothetical protein